MLAGWSVSPRPALTARLPRLSLSVRISLAFSEANDCTCCHAALSKASPNIMLCMALQVRSCAVCSVDCPAAQMGRPGAFAPPSLPPSAPGREGCEGALIVILSLCAGVHVYSKHKITCWSNVGTRRSLAFCLSGRAPGSAGADRGRGPSCTRRAHDLFKGRVGEAGRSRGKNASKEPVRVVKRVARAVWILRDCENVEKLRAPKLDKGGRNRGLGGLRARGAEISKKTQHGRRGVRQHRGAMPA